MKRTLYTTSEYVDALQLGFDGNLYECKGKYFALFSSPEAADYDAQWLVDHYKGEGVKKRKPVVYRVKLERVAKRPHRRPFRHFRQSGG